MSEVRHKLQVQGFQSSNQTETRTMFDADWTKPKLKRKHEESSSIKTQNQVSLCQVPQVEEKPLLQHGTSLELQLDTDRPLRVINREECDFTSEQCEVPIDIKEEPFDEMIVKEEPFDETVVKTHLFEKTAAPEEPFHEMIVKNETFSTDYSEPFDETISTEEPLVDTVVKTDPFDNTNVKEEAFDETVNKESSDRTVVNNEPFEETVIKSEERTDTVPCELLLLEEPDTNFLIPEDIVPESISQHPGDTVFVNNTNEFVRLVDIKDIFRNKVPSFSKSMAQLRTNIGLITKKSHHIDIATNSGLATVTNQSMLNHGTLNSTNFQSTHHPQKEIKSSDSVQSSNKLGLSTDENKNDFVSNLFPKKLSDFEQFYNHLCKFHLKFDHNTLNYPITVPRLLQDFKPYPNSLGRYQCSQCTLMFETDLSLEMHLKHIHHIARTARQVCCKVCLSHPKTWNLNWFLEHLPQHQLYYNHFVGVETEWQCTQCEILSNLGGEQRSKVTFHFKNLIIEKNQISPRVIHFQYKINPSLPLHHHKAINFSCVICTDTYETQQLLDQHLETHVDFVFKKCSECDEKCDNMNEYYVHIQEIHGALKMTDVDFSCNDCKISDKYVNTCSLAIQKSTKRFQHLKSIDYDGLECPICFVKFFDPKLFYSHCVPYSTLLPILMRECLKCKLQFKTDAESQAHLSSVHYGVYDYWCRICNIPQYSLRDHDNHVLSEHNVQAFHCVLCRSNLFHKQEVLDHLIFCYLKNSKLTADHEFVCPICGFICEDFDFLVHHIRVELNISLNQHQCKFCLNFFYGKFNLVCHMLHGKCDRCDLYFCNDKNLSGHVKIAHK